MDSGLRPRSSGGLDHTGVSKPVPLANAEPLGGRATQGAEYTCAQDSVSRSRRGVKTEAVGSWKWGSKGCQIWVAFFYRKERLWESSWHSSGSQSCMKRLLRLFKLCYSKDPRLCGTDKLTKAEERELEIGQYLLGQPKTKSKGSEKNPKKAWS